MRGAGKYFHLMSLLYQTLFAPRPGFPSVFLFVALQHKEKFPHRHKCVTNKPEASFIIYFFNEEISPFGQ